ncbi:MAG: GNAT family acetyltransferase [Methylocystis sp.]
MMETLSRATFAVASVTLMLLALALVGFGAFELVSALSQDWHEGGNAILTAIGYVVIALAVFDVAKYFVEEEVLRNRSLVTTSDVRRSLTKFISTIAIAVFIEGLVIVFQVSKHDVDKMPYPTALLATAILIVLGLGAYQRLNVEVERQVDRKDNAEQFTAKLDAAADNSPMADGPPSSPESLKIFRFLLDFWESWRLSRVRNGVGI